MPIQWTLKKWLAVEHDIYRPSELRERILERTGVALSHQAVSDLVRRPPKALKLSTMEVLCTTFQCALSDFCQVLPGKPKPGRLKRPYAAHGKRRRERAVTAFPAPSDFAAPAPSDPRARKG